MLSPVEHTTTTKKKKLSQSSQLKDIFDHCCQICHYSFGIKECCVSTCSTYKQIPLPPDIFATLYHLPHPVISADGHYLPFNVMVQKWEVEACVLGEKAH